MFSQALATSASAAPAEATLLRATFQLVAGVGPTREQRLWTAGITDWSLIESTPAGICPPPLFQRLVTTVKAAESALAALDLPTLAHLLPTRELWRLFPTFGERAVYLDIECEGEDGISAIGLLRQEGPRILLHGRDLAAFPALVPPDCLLVTFNGAAFDVPRLARAFPDWEPPAAHIDLRPVWTRLGQWGGLKLIEESLGMGRPDHLRGLDGNGACWLWRAAKLGDQRALLRFAEYNLYDAINLRALLVMAHDRLAEATGLPCPKAPPFSRGDVLYDVSKLLLAL